MSYYSSIGDLFVSSSQKELNKSAVADSEENRKLQEQLLSYMQTTKATASGDTSSDQKKYIILAGVGILLVFTILTVT
jgi:Flp pilus assembly protein TadB